MVLLNIHLKIGPGFSTGTRFFMIKASALTKRRKKGEAVCLLMRPYRARQGGRPNEI
jgi:hypothetical protein